MVSKSQIKLITSLEQKKHRTKTGLFVVEGKKGISEFLNSPMKLHSLFTTGFDFNSLAEKTTLVTEAELKKISNLKTPQTALAIFEIPEETEPKLHGLTLALDSVRDPGNLGTIIRLCDWFGIDELLCSVDTVDCYNPKVVQASMGSLSRVHINYIEIKEFLGKQRDLPVLGTFLDGQNVYTTAFPRRGILIMGNEANGISEEIEKLVTGKLMIPHFGSSANTESLNVATATAVFLSEYSRQNLLKSKV